MPARTCWMTGRGPVTVSTRASGQAPIAARSLTLVITAAIPAPYGSAATNEGRMASPPTTRDVPAAGTTAPSSPGPASQSLLPKTSLTSPISALATTPGWVRTRWINSGRPAGIRAPLRSILALKCRHIYHSVYVGSRLPRPAGQGNQAARHRHHPRPGPGDPAGAGGRPASDERVLHRRVEARLGYFLPGSHPA